MELRVGGKYRLGRKIGSGSFGDIYLGELYYWYMIQLQTAIYIYHMGLDVKNESHPRTCTRML